MLQERCSLLLVLAYRGNDKKLLGRALFKDYVNYRSISLIKPCLKFLLSSIDIVLTFRKMHNYSYIVLLHIAILHCQVFILICKI